MILERSDVRFPLWRKKVDRSLLQQGVTPLPAWVASMWRIDLDFTGVESKRVKEAAVSVSVAGIPSADAGWVTSLTKGRSAPLYRLFVGDVAKAWLRRSFRMSYLRAVEAVLAGGDDDGAERDAPFWEFLDIEYDRASRRFYLVAHYKHRVMFPHATARFLDNCPIEELFGEEGNDCHAEAT